MAKRAKIFGIFFVAVLVLVGGFAPVIDAVENGGVGGRPAKPRADNPRSESIFVHELEPGSSIEDAVTVINNTDEQKQIQIAAVDGLVSSGGAFACKQNVEPREQAGLWISLSKTTVEVAAKGRVEVPFTISVPDDASVGEQNACITFQAIEAPVDSGVNGVQLSFRSAIRVAVTIPGEITKELRFGERTVLIKEDKVTLSEKLFNSGNVSIDAEIKTTLRPLLFGSSEERGGDYPVLRGQESEFNFDFERPYWGGWYRISSVANYNADTSVSLGESSEKSSQLTNNETIFIMPKSGALLTYFIGLIVVAAVLLQAYKIKQRNTLMHLKAELYTVQSADTVQTIAEKVGMSWKDIVKLNQLKAPYDISSLKEIKVVHKNADVVTNKQKTESAPRKNSPKSTPKKATKKTAAKTPKKTAKKVAVKVTKKSAKKVST